MSDSSAARTNLTSQQVSISNRVIGEGTFRICYAGTYIGGNRNQQEAACKTFKSKYRILQDEFFAKDEQVIRKAIRLCEDWNDECPYGKEILMTLGDVKQTRSGNKFLVEPLIRYYTKFTSNNGWIGDSDTLGWAVLAMEAFSHFTYHRSGGQLIVCDLQGRYRHNRYNRSKCRFELTDPAICSRNRSYGPTDMGEKGIESFFYHHECNSFCGDHWQRPRYPTEWFSKSSCTSMLSSRHNHQLNLRDNTTRFNGFSGLAIGTIEEYDDSDSDSDSDY